MLLIKVLGVHFFFVYSCLRKVVKKSGKVHETNPKGIVGSFQVMVP